MPAYKVTAPDGKSYTVNAPDGASQDDVMAYVQANYQHPTVAGGGTLQGTPQPSTAPSAPAAAPQQDAPSFLDQLGRASLRTGRDVAQGAISLGDLLATPIRSGLNAVLPASAQLSTGADAVGQYAQKLSPTSLDPQNAGERYGDAISRGIGGAVGGMGLGSAMSGVAQPVVAGIGRTLASNPGGQLAAATTGATTSQIAKDAGAGSTGQILAGIGGALVPGSLAAVASGSRNAIGAALAPEAQQQSLAQQALARGIPLKASQVNGGQLAKYLDSVTSMVPLSGAKSFDQAQSGAWNQALGKEIGAPTATRITPTVFAQAKNDTSDIYNDLWNRNNLPVSQGLQKDFSDVIQSAASAKPEVLSKIQGYWNRITNGVQQSPGSTPSLPGSSFKAIDSDMSRDAMSADPETRHYIGQIQDSLRSAMGQGMSQQDQDLLSLANQRWGAIKTLAPLVAKSSDGNISPAALQNAVANNSASKMAMATGNRGELGTLARIGQGLLKEPPQSGTEPRMLIRNLLGGVGSIGGAVAGGSVLGAGGTLATGAGIVGGSRLAQMILQNPQVVARAAGVPMATPNYLSGIPVSALPNQAVPLLQSPNGPSR